MKVDSRGGYFIQTCVEGGLRLAITESELVTVSSVKSAAATLGWQGEDV